MYQNIDVTSFRGDWAVFSNFYHSPVKLDGVQYPTVENAFQAAKTLNPEERKVFTTCRPDEAKRYGRKVKLREDWEQVKEAVMLRLLMQKFKPGTENFEKLLSTGDGRIVEGNTWHDNIWGDCQCQRCVNTPGKNRLGNLLMAIRDVSTAKKIIKQGKFERRALIAPKEWEESIEADQNLAYDLVTVLGVQGVLHPHHGVKELYHYTNAKVVPNILAEGFKVGGGSGTFGNDVVYAYETPDVPLAPGFVWLKVRVSSYMRSSITAHKIEEHQHECIFFPEHVLSIDPL